MRFCTTGGISRANAADFLVLPSVACVGSANFNSRSSELDEEVGLVVLDNDVVTTLDNHFEIDLDRSEEIDEARWQDRPLRHRLMEKATKPFHHQV